MALSGHPIVLATSQRDADGAAEDRCRQGRDRRPRCRLVLLAAESAAQPGHIDLKVIHRQPEYPGDDALDRGRRLGG